MFKRFCLAFGICVAKIHNNLRILFAQVKKNALFSSFSVIFSLLRRKTAYLMSNFASGNSKQAFFGIKIIKVSAVIACYFVVRVA